MRQVLEAMATSRPRLALCVLSAVCFSCAAQNEGAYVDTDAEFDRAVSLRSAGEHAAAATAFGEFAQEFEHDRRADLAQYLSGEEYIAAGREQAAFEAFCDLYRRFSHSRYLTRADRTCVETGKRLLGSGNSQGVDFLEKVTNRAPYGELAAEAHTALGKYYYENHRFADAGFEFDAAVKGVRDPRLRAQAQLGAALCEYRQIDRPVRNMGHVLEARERLRKLRTAPLDADDMRTADRYLDAALDLAAEHHLRMVTFYLKQGELAPGLAHLREVIENYPGTRYSEAAARLVLFIQKERRKASK